jgi:aminomuconate-semialdehyde/2-hydroxymuconate-6-semialdehyde dehydrogenase
MEEIFGPVVTLQSFKTEDEALMLANTSDYGLSATIWTQDVSRANRIAGKVNSGIIWVNCWLLRDLRTPFRRVQEQWGRARRRLGGAALLYRA